MATSKINKHNKQCRPSALTVDYTHNIHIYISHTYTLLKYASQIRHRLKIQLIRPTHTLTSISFSHLHTHITTPFQPAPHPPPSHTHLYTQPVYMHSTYLFFKCTNKYSHRLKVQQLKQHTYSYTHTHKLHECIVLKKKKKCKSQNTVLTQ